MSRRRAGRIPAGLLGMLALVAVTERALSRRSADLSSAASADWRQSGRAARSSVRTADVLIFGDSMAKFGIAPRVLEDSLGLRAYNLALYGGAPETSYYLLRRALDAGARPKAVIVDFQAELLLADHVTNQRRNWPELLTMAESFDLAWTARDPQFFLRTLTDTLLPSSRCRFEVRSLLMAALQGRDGSSTRRAIEIYRRNWAQNRGAQLLPRNPNYHGDVPSNYALFFPRWSPLSVNKRFVQRFLSLASSCDIPVVWMIQPYVPPAQARREQLGMDRRFDAFVRRMQVMYPGVTVVDARHSGYEPAVFVDAVHLDHQGAATLSEDLASTLRTLWDGRLATGWTSLAHYRDRSIRTPLEDVGQSRIALDRIGSVRK